MSLPISNTLNVPVTNLTHLKKFLGAQSLPNGWIEYSNSTTEGTLVLIKLSINLSLLSADATFMVKVDGDFRWTLSCHGTLVEVDQCQVLSSVPRQLNSAGAVLNLLTTLQSSGFCCGNPVADFQQFVSARGGEFKDSTGTVCFYIAV